MNLKKSQRIFKRQLIHEVEIYRKKRFRDGSKWLEEFVFLKKIQCRISTNSIDKSEQQGDGAISEGKQQFLTPFKMYSLPEDIKPDDRIVFYNKTIDKRYLFQVAKEPRDPSFLGHHYETPLDEIDLAIKFSETNGTVYLQVTS